MSEIAERVNLIKVLIENLYSVAGFNAYRAGQGGQYASNVNISTQQQSSYNQTENMFETHRLIVEKACTRLMNIARHFYKKRPHLLKNILSPTSYTELIYGVPFWYSHFKVRLENSGKVARQVEMLKQYMQAFIQNGMQPVDIITMALAESKGDMLDLMNRLDTKRKEEIAAAQQSEQASMQQQIEAQKAMREEEKAFMLQMQELKERYAQIRSENEAQKFKIAADIDADGKSDLLQGQIAKLEMEMQKHKDKMELEYAKLNKES